MNQYLMSYMDADGHRWITCGIFRAKTAAGAISQLMRDAKHFPSMVAVRADLQ